MRTTFVSLLNVNNLVKKILIYAQKRVIIIYLPKIKFNYIIQIYHLKINIFHLVRTYTLNYRNVVTVKNIIY